MARNKNQNKTSTPVVAPATPSRPKETGGEDDCVPCRKGALKTWKDSPVVNAAIDIWKKYLPWVVAFLALVSLVHAFIASPLKPASKEKTELERVMSLPHFPNGEYVGVALNTPTPVTLEPDRWSKNMLPPVGATVTRDAPHKGYWVWYYEIDRQPISVGPEEAAILRGKQGPFRILGDDVMTIIAK